jgi:uncharacterized protein YciI
MKKTFCLLIIILVSGSIFPAQNRIEKESAAQKKIKLKKHLRKTLSLSNSFSSETEKKSFLVIYKPGAAWLKGKPVAEQPLQEHGKYLLSLYKSGILRSAGPFADDTGGAAILEATDEAEAKSLIDRDPAVTSGVMIYELHLWRLVPWERYVKNK